MTDAAPTSNAASPAIQKRSLVSIPKYGEVEGNGPIVILGPNGSGKTKLAQQMAADTVAAISAQRRTWLDDSLPVQQEEQLRANSNQRRI